MFEDLVITVEPYASFRFTLGLVLTGVTIYLLVNSLISLRQFLTFLRDLDQQVAGQRMLDQARLALDPEMDLSKLPPLRARPGRIIRQAVLISLLRLVSWRSFANNWREWMILAALSTACLPAYWYVFNYGGL